PGADLLDVRSLRAVSVSEVQFPSAKGMLVEPRAFHLRGSPYGAASEISIFGDSPHRLAFSTAFVDQHVETLPFRDMAAPVVQELGETAPILSTKEGSRGRDVR